MRTEQRPLRHVLYTNAAGPDGQGHRPLLNYFGAATEEAVAVNLWLQSLVASSLKQRGWAAHSFLIEGIPHAALAVYEPHFDRDERGRAAELAHALIVPVPQGEASGQFGVALLSQARLFLPEQPAALPPLDRYLDGCQINLQIAVKLIRPEELREVDPFFLRQLLATSSRMQGSLPREVSFPSAGDEEGLAELMVQASAALPPRLRLALRWGVGLQPNEQMFVAHPQRGWKRGAEETGASAAYFEWLSTRMTDGRSDELLRIIENWEINSWERLEQAIATAAPEQREEDETMRRRREEGASSPSTSAGETSKSPEVLDREHRAMADALMDYVDKRFQRLSVAEVSREEASPEGTAPWWKPLRRLRYDLYFLVLILLLLRLSNLITEKNLSPPVESTPSTEAGQRTDLTTDNGTSSATAGNEPVAATTADQEAFQSWETFLKSEQAGLWFKELANSTRLQPTQVAQDVKQRAALWAAARDTGRTTLTSSEKGIALLALYEYVHACWAKDKGMADPGANRVDLNGKEVSPKHRSELIKDLGLTQVLGEDPLPGDTVREAVVLAYLKKVKLP